LISRFIFLSDHLTLSFYTFQLEKTRLRADNFEKETELLKDELKGLQQQLNEVARYLLISHVLAINCGTCSTVLSACNFVSLLFKLK